MKIAGASGDETGRPLLRTILMAAPSYWHDTRAPRYSILFALPLLLLYEVMAAALAGPEVGVRNGADVLLQALVASAVGRQGILYVTAAVIVLCAAWVVRDARRHGGIRFRWFPLMLAESVVLAVVFALVVSIATSQVLSGIGVAFMTVDTVDPGAAGLPRQMGTATAIMLSLGAGLYEELVFRVLLVTGLAAGVRTLLKASQVTAGVTAVILSAVIFSAFHYIGPFGDAFTVRSFTFRTIAGLAFSALYLLRGFGLTAWTHALYDVGLMVL